MNRPGIQIKGMYHDILKGPDGRIIFDSGWKSNTFLLEGRKLIAAFMKNESPSGIQYLAVGRGEKEWDVAIPAPDPNETTTLVNPYEKTILLSALQISYLDDHDNVVSGTTGRLQIKAEFGQGFFGDETYPLREFGLFGKFGGKDCMINCVRHQAINKDKESTLLREIHLQF